MSEDFDFLQSQINRYFSPLPLLESRTGISVNAEIDKLKHQISEIKSIEEFVEIVRQCLNILNDGHSRIATKSQIKWYVSSPYNYLSTIGNATLNDTINADYYYGLTTDIYSKIKLNLPIKYMTGKYYNVLPFEHNNIVIRPGEEVSAVNGMPVNDFVDKNRCRIYHLCWDPVGKQWYSRLLYAALPKSGKEQFTLTIGGKEIPLDCTKSVKTLQNRHQTDFSPKIFSSEDKILYIHMPTMMNKQWYTEEFFRKYVPDTEKIVIDIRDNGGGDDSVWRDLLKKIVDKPLTYRYNVRIPHDKTLENAVNSFGKLTINGNDAFVDTTIIIRPDDNSVHFKGKIYVLQNNFTFSAAAALSAVAMQNENMILVGEPTAFISGFTFPGIMLKLPHSGIVFKLAFSSDAVGGESNPYMDRVEIQIAEDDITEFIDKYLNHDCYGKEYLWNKDKLIGYVKDDAL